MPGRYRRSGADPPFGDPRGYHGTTMEGYFWRLTDVAQGTVVVVLAGISRDAGGRPWGTVGLAAHPGGFSRSAALPEARADAHGIGVWAGDGHRTALRATPDRIEVDLGAGARLHARFDGIVGWPRGAFGGVGAAHAVPGLSQYWHPHALGGRATAQVQAGDRRFALDGAAVYAEKNWGAGGFPPAWWWGQAQGFERDDVCIAFAGGRAGVGPLRVLATSVVARVGEDTIRIVRPPAPIAVDVGDGGWRLRARGPRHAIDIEGHAGGTEPHVLPVPVPALRSNLEGAARQHLAGAITVRVRRGRRTLFAGSSALAGLERGEA